MIILDASHVLLDSHKGLLAIFLVQEPRSGRRVRQQEEGAEAPEDSSSTENDENGLCGRAKLAFEPFTERENECNFHCASQRSPYLPRSDAVNMANSIVEERAEHARTGIAQEPGSVAERLLLSFIPHGDDDGKTRRNRCFGNAEEDAGGEQAGCIVAGRCEHEDSTPDKTVEEIFASVQKVPFSSVKKSSSILLTWIVRWTWPPSNGRGLERSGMRPPGSQSSIWHWTMSIRTQLGSGPRADPGWPLIREPSCRETGKNRKMPSRAGGCNVNQLGSFHRAHALL